MEVQFLPYPPMKYIKSKPIGIIGGMGPYASAYFYKLLLDKSKVYYRGPQNNDDFPEILLDSLPVPYFISDSANYQVAKEMLINRVQKMNHFGVGMIGMVCNMAHLMHHDLQSAASCEFVSIIQEVSAKVKRLKLSKVGILATPMTIQSNLYGYELGKLNITTIYPPLKIQREHEQVIRQVVAGNAHTVDTRRLKEFTQNFYDQNNLDGIVLACTELPLVFPKDESMPVIDCLNVLADSLLVRYYHKEEI
jgi:aspartate racemase